MEDTIDNDVSNLSDRKLWDIIRLSAIVATDAQFLAEVRSEIQRRDCGSEARQLQRYLFSSSLVDEYGREIPITEDMVARACRWSTPMNYPSL